MATDSQDTLDTELGADAQPSHHDHDGEDLSQLDAMIRADAEESGFADEAGDATQPGAKPDNAGKETNDKTDSATRESLEKKDEATEKKDEGTDADDPDAGKSKWEREQARKDRSWKKLNEEKEAFRKEREAILAEKAQLAAENERLKTEHAAKSTAKHSPEAYEKFANTAEAEADRLEANGDYEAANQKRHLAEAARQEASSGREAAEQARKAQPDEQALNTKRLAMWEKAKQEVPAVLQAGSLEQQITREVMTELKHLINVPEMPLMAARFAAEKAKASRVPELEKELETARVKIRELEEATALPGGSSPGAPPPQRDFNQLSIEEQEKQLEAELMGAR